MGGLMIDHVARFIDREIDAIAGDAFVRCRDGAVPRVDEGATDGEISRGYDRNVAAVGRAGG
jgi:hypothetical protein